MWSFTQSFTKRLIHVGVCQEHCHRPMKEHKCLLYLLLTFKITYLHLKLVTQIDLLCQG